MDNNNNNEPLEWNITQELLDPKEEEELISAIAFNASGNVIATGDKSGFINIFQNQKDTYKSIGRFRSHESEFDYLKSLEIEEKINKIKFLHETRDSNYLLSTNDKTIKLWRVFKEPTKVTNYKKVNGFNMPTISKGETEFHSKVKKVYANAHAYHINSISPNCDGETFISSDDLRINLWNLEITNQSFNIVDIKPENMEELTEVITSSEFHPTECNIFMYSSSKGTIKLCDTRDSSLCDKSSKTFEEIEDPVNKSFFSEIISSISDIKFSPDGRYIIARDYMSLKIWDINMEAKPVKVIPVHDYLKPKLCDLYENDCIFDKFECSSSRSANHIVSGSYGDFFLIYDVHNNIESRMEVRKAKRTKPINPESIAYEKKCTQISFHPFKNTFAVASGSNVVLYNGKPK